MRISGIAMAVSALGIFAAAAAPWSAVPTAEPAAPASRSTLESDGGVLRLAQTYSSKCVTPTTICFVNPAPVGNPCSCGASQGRIQR
ncbi:hypothetical protein P2H44_22510 [Albimonas sp. CAU 1670]|uniref:hypothetical protein n=1 Tax=Albimonas sp. CAU 1670 TaxID=3032599 RepID=UPI0023DA5C36|nr:hypothetical protein [Albimonas sp. CAU 1670]MDF2235341.1 hypothetical protein [Albimonas sp. CAU 1670]